MVRAPRSRRPARSDRDDDDRPEDEHEPERRRRREREPFDDPVEHLEIERRRFHGGLPPTPELYALAREQWYRLPGALVRPSMDTEGDEPDGKGPQR